MAGKKNAPDPLFSSGRIFSVSEIVQQAQEALEQIFTGVMVRGEASNVKEHVSGHLYFTLKDSSSQIRCAMFKSSNRYLRFRLKDGLQVIASGRLSIYPSRGDFQLVVDSLEPAGLGALRLAFDQLKEKLKAEGLFDSRRKKTLPEFPRRIAIVTSPSGAAIHDILNVINRRLPLADISLYPVQVQGAGAAEEIAYALNRLNAVGGWDVIICGRGGGSLEDLWAFNEEIVARAVAASRIPVISAVGHETDITIADFVADVRAETPTAAAELVVRDQQDLKRRVRHSQCLIAAALGEQLRTFKHRLDQLLDSPVLRQPRRAFEPLAQRLDDLTLTLRRQWANRLRYSQGRVAGLIGQLEALSPLKVLGRGYSLVYSQPNGELVRDAGQLVRGQEVTIQFHRGRAGCRVEKTE